MTRCEKRSQFALPTTLFLFSFSHHTSARNIYKYIFIAATAGQVAASLAAAHNQYLPRPAAVAGGNLGNPRLLGLPGSRQIRPRGLVWLRLDG